MASIADLRSALHGAWLVAEIDAVLGVNFVESDGEEKVIDVVAAEVGIAVGGLHLEYPVAELENGDVERAAAQVVDRDCAFLRAIEAVGKRRRSRFVDEAKNFEPGHAACVACRLACAAGRHWRKVRGANRDDRLRNGRSPKKRSALRLSWRRM